MMNSSQKQSSSLVFDIIRNSFWRNLHIFSKMLFLFAVFYVASFYLEPVEFGELNYLSTLLVLIAFFADFGLSTAVSKFALEYSDRQETTGDLFATSILANTLIALGVAFAAFFYFVNRGQAMSVALFIGLYVIFYSISGILDGYYRAKAKFRPTSLIFIAMFFIFIPLSIVVIPVYRIKGVFIVYDLYYAISSFVLLFAFGWEKGKLSATIAKTVAKYSLIVGLTSVFYYLFTRIDVLFLKHFGYILEIGYFEIVNKFYSLILVVFTSIGFVIATRSVSHYSRTIKRDFSKIFLRENSLFLAFSLGITIISYAIFPFLVKIFFTKYNSPQIFQIFNILLLILPLRAIAETAVQGYIIPTGHANLVLQSMIIGSILNVVLDYVFIINFGYIGVVYSTMISSIISILIYLARYFFILRLKSKQI